MRSDVFHIFLLCLTLTWVLSEVEMVIENDLALEQDSQLEIQDIKTNQNESSREINTPVDIWAELKELRDMTIQMNADLIHYMSKIEKLEQEKSALEVRISLTEMEMNEIKMQNAALEVRMISNEKEVEEIRTEIADQPKVAFSAAFSTTGGFGPFNTEVTLKFSEILTNFGGAYNPTTGIFTAPVRGIYFFRLTVYELRPKSWVGVYLYHNSKIIFGAFEYNDGTHESASNASVLQLEQGDVVFLNLAKGFGLYNDGNNYCIFSGFLLFPL